MEMQGGGIQGFRDILMNCRAFSYALQEIQGVFRDVSGSLRDFQVASEAFKIVSIFQKISGLSGGSEKVSRNFQVCFRALQKVFEGEKFKGF